MVYIYDRWKYHFSFFLLLIVGANIAWVQHAKTGELVPVVIRGGDASDEQEQEEADKNNNNDQQRQPLLLPTPLIASGADVEGGQAYASNAMEVAQFDEATHSFDDTVVLIRSAFLFAQGECVNAYITHPLLNIFTMFRIGLFSINIK